jgi:hypothetical protein
MYSFFFLILSLHTHSLLLSFSVSFIHAQWYVLVYAAYRFPYRLNPRPEYSFDDVASNIRLRAAAVSNEHQLSQLLGQIVNGLEVQPPPPVEVPLATVAAAAAAVANGGAVSSEQIADLIQQLAKGSISQKDLHSQLVGSPRSSRHVKTSPTDTDTETYVCAV